MPNGINPLKILSKVVLEDIDPTSSLHDFTSMLRNSGSAVLKLTLEGNDFVVDIRKTPLNVLKSADERFQQNSDARFRFIDVLRYEFGEAYGDFAESRLADDGNFKVRDIRFFATLGKLFSLGPDPQGRALYDVNFGDAGTGLVEFLTGNPNNKTRNAIIETFAARMVQGYDFADRDDENSFGTGSELIRRAIGGSRVGEGTLQDFFEFMLREGDGFLFYSTDGCFASLGQSIQNDLNGAVYNTIVEMVGRQPELLLQPGFFEQGMQGEICNVIVEQTLGLLGFFDELQNSPLPLDVKSILFSNALKDGYSAQHDRLRQESLKSIALIKDTLNANGCGAALVNLISGQDAIDSSEVVEALNGFFNELNQFAPGCGLRGRSHALAEVLFHAAGQVFANGDGPDSRVDLERQALALLDRAQFVLNQVSEDQIVFEVADQASSLLAAFGGSRIASAKMLDADNREMAELFSMFIDSGDGNFFDLDLDISAFPDPRSMLFRADLFNLRDRLISLGPVKGHLRSLDDAPKDLKTALFEGTGLEGLASETGRQRARGPDEPTSGPVLLINALNGLERFFSRNIHELLESGDHFGQVFLQGYWGHLPDDVRFNLDTMIDLLSKKAETALRALDDVLTNLEPVVVFSSDHDFFAKLYNAREHDPAFLELFHSRDVLRDLADTVQENMGAFHQIREFLTLVKDYPLEFVVSLDARRKDLL
ncbi:hypothetical protein [Roseibium sp.]|uniref:hypothetical protein n=2 Tax=Roseibium sp. TaxID=1936156 RepID=UPI0032670BA4